MEGMNGICDRCGAVKAMKMKLGDGAKIKLTGVTLGRHSCGGTFRVADTPGRSGGPAISNVAMSPDAELR